MESFGDKRTKLTINRKPSVPASIHPTRPVKPLSLMAIGGFD